MLSSLPSHRPFGLDNIDAATYSPPASPTYVTTPDAALLRPLSTAGAASTPPVTILDQFRNAVANNGSNTAIKVSHKSGEWIDITWQQFYDDASAVGLALIAQGLQAHQCVNILGANAYEWFVANYAAIIAGGLIAGIYPTNSAQDCNYVLGHSNAHAIFINGEVFRKYKAAYCGMKGCCTT